MATQSHSIKGKKRVDAAKVRIRRLIAIGDEVATMFMRSHMEKGGGIKILGTNISVPPEKKTTH